MNAYRWLDDDGPAPDGPGLAPRWTSSQKDAVSTAYAASSRVWYTLSHGTLNEIYSPTIDHPQTRDMELLFTDEQTFFHEEKRDLSYDFNYIDPGATPVRVSATSNNGYTVTKQFCADPHQPVVLMHVSLSGDEALLQRMKCYALLSPHLDGGGAGNSARSVEVAGQRAIVAWKNRSALAFGVSCGFARSSCGYVGTSDGYQDISSNMRMEWNYGQALDGNIAVMGEIDIAKHREFTIAIAFGGGLHAALTHIMQTLATPFAQHLDRVVVQWHRSPAPTHLMSAAGDGGRLASISHRVILTHEDKTYAGAFIASASIPWGASKSDDDLGGYHLVWTRDMVQSATALLACGETETARGALVYLACTQRPDGSFAQNFWVNGEAYWSGIQLDEVAFPIILAWRLWKCGGLGNFDVFPFVANASAFLCRYAPVTQQERWEEIGGYSPSTLAAVITGLLCAADIMRAHQAVDVATFTEEFADWIEAHLDEWTTTDDGLLLPGVKCHYMRIRPPDPGEAFHDSSVAPGNVRLTNRAPGEQSEFDAREIVDAGFLELVRYGIRRPDDPLILESLRVVDATLKYQTPYGDAWRRYNHDGYGQKKDGSNYDGWGQGRCWPLLGGERAHYELAAGHDVRPFVTAYEHFASAGGMFPEQVWDHEDIPAQEMFRGKSAGSAQPLVWAHAEYLKLLRSLSDGRVFDRISVVEDRYLADERKFKSNIEIFQINRPLARVGAGSVLRVHDPDKFCVRYTTDNWATQQTIDAHAVGRFGFYVDVPTPETAGTLTFTLYWPGTGQPGGDHWLGRNIDVALTQKQ